jgi:hypothetical protein
MAPAIGSALPMPRLRQIGELIRKHPRSVLPPGLGQLVSPVLIASKQCFVNETVQVKHCRSSFDSKETFQKLGAYLLPEAFSLDPEHYLEYFIPPEQRPQSL